MAPKRTAKSSASSKGATKSTPSTGTRKSSRTTRATSSEPRQLRSTSTDAPDLFGSQDPEEILKKARKQKQSSRASSRALSEDPGPNDERPDEPVNESANKSSKPESPSPSAEQAETSSGRADEQPTNVANQSSRQSSVESIAPTVEESTLQTFHQHNLSVVIEDPTEESVLSQHASSTKYKRQTHAQQTSSTQYTSNTHYTQEVQSIDYGTGTFSETAREPSFSSESERGSPSPLLEPTQPSFPVEETIDIATQPQTITQQTEVIELSSGSEGEDNDFEGDYQHGYQESQYYQDPCRVESIIDEDSEGQYEDEGRNDVDSEDDLEDDHERDHDEDDDDMEDLLAGSLQEANTLTPRVALNVAKSPVLTENESAEAMTNEHSQPHPAPHTEDVETTSSSAQIATNDKPKDDTPSKNTTKESAKDGTTPMDTDAPGTPKVPASASVLSRMYQTFVSPIKFFTGGSGKESTPLLSKKIPSTINKLDKKSPSKRLGHTPKFMPQTPTKSARAMASPEKAYFPHSEKSVKFTPPRAISEAPSASSNTPNDSSRAWTQYYLHHGVRKRHIRKWNEFQLWQQTRSDVETLADAQRITDMMYERSLFEQAEQRRVSKLNCQAGLSSVTSSKKRTADAFSTAEDSPAKKQRLAFSSKQTVAPPGSKAPVPGQVGYHSSTELPPAGASSIWVPDSVRASPARGNEESPTTSHLFGSTTVPGASLGHNATSNTDVGSERSSPGRTFGCDFDDDDMSMISQAASIGRTFKVPDDSDDETMDESMEDSAGEDWRDKPLSQWTKSNMDAYKKAPLSTGAEAPEPSLLAAVKSVLADSVPDAVGQAHNQLDFPRLTELGMSYRDFLTVYYPDNRGVITYTRSDYYHNLVKPPGTESMNADERARWKFQQEWKDWRKFGEAVRLYKEDDTPSLVAQIDGRRQEIKDKRKRADDEEQQLVLQSQELERRKQRLDLEEKELESRRTSLEQQKKAVDSIPPPPPKQNIFTAPSKSSVFNSLMSDLENQSQKAQPGSSFQDAASRVTVPSTNNSRSATSQAPLSSTISPQNPPPFIYDGQGNVVASTPSAPTASTSTWTQPPPPAPSPAHAQLPQTKTVQVPAAPANKYAPKRPSRLREMETHSSPMKSIEAHDEPDFMKAIPTMTSFEPMFANGRLPTPPEPDISEILQAMAKFAAQGNREPFYGGIAPPSS